ncbi:MAG: sigma-70 family RNA polymerase sigma factor [Anaerolineae bacterium]|nr:sigma-70 family RNA polymerase sigma factor [Phycisphaerae bacterium]
MQDDPAEQDLVDRARTDEAAKQALFLQCYDRLLRLIRRNLPLAIEHLVSPEDVLQDTYALAFQKFSSFEYQQPGSFYRWIATIARNRVVSTLDTLFAQKRGGGRHGVSLSQCDSDSAVLGLLHIFHRGEKSPRQLAADREAFALIQSAMTLLPSDQLHAVQLRYGHGLSVRGAAAQMNRTEQAVKMLCFRALRQLRSVFPHSSRDPAKLQ